MALSNEIYMCIEFTGHLIGCDKKSEIVGYFQGGLCDEKGLLCNKLCDFCGLIYIVLILFNRQLECKEIMKHLF